MPADEGLSSNDKGLSKSRESRNGRREGAKDSETLQNSTHDLGAKRHMQGYAVQVISHNKRLRTIYLGNRWHRTGYICSVEHSVAMRKNIEVFLVLLWKDHKDT